MKNFKRFAFILAVATLFIGLSSCKKCKNEAPRARIINNAGEKASVQIQTSNGNTVNINNVDPGTNSDYASYAAGEVTFTVKMSNVDYVKTVPMSECFEYDIIIEPNKEITSVAVDRNE